MGVCSGTYANCEASVTKIVSSTDPNALAVGFSLLYTEYSSKNCVSENAIVESVLVTPYVTICTDSVTHAYIVGTDFSNSIFPLSLGGVVSRYIIYYNF